MSPFVAACLACGHLLPSLLWFEFLRIASREELERWVRVTFEVNVAQRMLAHKPVGAYKVGHKNASDDLVTGLVIFNWIADFSGPKGTGRILAPNVESRINGHLANLVSRANAALALSARMDLTILRRPWRSVAWFFVHPERTMMPY
jgi:hypothetical protein